MKPGLYYPYIHIRDINWLKGALLLFPKVYRIVPRRFNRFDDPNSSIFAYKEGSEGPLLDAAYTYDPGIELALKTLLAKLKHDVEDPQFLTRLQEPSAHAWRAERRLRLNTIQPGSGDLDDDVTYGAQLHREKLCPDLISFLEEHHLCWKPYDPEPNDPDAYVEVHKHLAEVIMSTASIAFAVERGADIVSDDKHEQLHRFLVEKRYEDLYKAWLDPETWPAGPRQQTGRRVFEFMLELQGDVAALTPDKIIELSEERAAIDDLIAKLERQASNIRGVDTHELDEQMKTLITAVLKDWEKNRPLGSRWWREFGGTDAIPVGADFVKNISEKALSPAAAGVSAGAYLGSLDAGGLIVGGIGLAIGVVAHGVSSLGKAISAGHKDPHRYLTSLTKAGVKFNIPVPHEREENRNKTCE